MGDVELCLQVQLDGHLLLSVACLPPGHLLVGAVLLGRWLPSVHDARDIVGLFLNKDKQYNNNIIKTIMYYIHIILTGFNQWEINYLSSTRGHRIFSFKSNIFNEVFPKTNRRKNSIFRHPKLVNNK